MNKNDQIKHWVSTWQKADSSLKAIKILELRKKDYYLKNRDVLNKMLQYAFDKHNVRIFSGMVTQQNIFKSYYLKNFRVTQ